MKKLDVLKAEFRGDKMVLVWHRYNTEDSNNDAVGIWFVFKVLTDEEVLEYAKMHVDSDIEVRVLS